MDFYKDFERKVENKMTLREKQERIRIEGKSQEHMVPYKSTMPKGIGEFSASDEDKLKVKSFKFFILDVEIYVYSSYLNLSR